jgi:hypothetical protein
MGTPHGIDSRLIDFVSQGDRSARILVEILVENYKNNNLGLHINNKKKFSKKVSFFTLVDSEFENIFLSLLYYADSKYSNVYSNLYELKFEARGLDSPIFMVISLDDSLVDLLPPQMKKDLDDKIHEEFN